MGGNVMIAGLVLIGTVLQMREALLALRGTESAATFHAIDDLRSAVPLWRFLAWRRHRRILGTLREESPDEWAAYRRLSWTLVSWSMLAAAAGIGLVVAVAPALG